ncbi:MAG: isoprenylcysteine carboxylmethyltransferase family protein [Chloroflexi bacterium]|nr:isoprenylcysteine carboxylmethyltransferase family protein [Chloroflexota bacterium]
MTTQEETISPQAFLRFALGTLIIPAFVLFVAAGQVDWALGWAYITLLWLAGVISRLIVWRVNPSLLVERSSFGKGKNVEPWDRIMSLLIGLVGPLAMLIVAGLDHRFGWSPNPTLAVMGAAWLVIAIGYTLATWAMIENRFFSGYVRIQDDRGHVVIDSGPYAFVRHPGYASVVFAYLATPFALGTLWVLIPVLLWLVAIVVRTALEDQTLQTKLPGYAEYAQRVRYRLFPGIW